MSKQTKKQTVSTATESVLSAQERAQRVAGYCISIGENDDKIDALKKAAGELVEKNKGYWTNIRENIKGEKFEFGKPGKRAPQLKGTPFVKALKNELKAKGVSESIRNSYVRCIAFGVEPKACMSDVYPYLVGVDQVPTKEELTVLKKEYEKKEAKKKGTYVAPLTMADCNPQQQADIKEAFEMLGAVYSDRMKPEMYNDLLKAIAKQIPDLLEHVTPFDLED